MADGLRLVTAYLHDKLAKKSDPSIKDNKEIHSSECCLWFLVK